MTANVKWLGLARVGVDPRGKAVIDKNSIRGARDRYEGEDDELDDEDDDLDGEDLEGDDLDGDEAEGDEELGDMLAELGDEIAGRRKRRGRGKKLTRSERQQVRALRKELRNNDVRGRDRGPRKEKDKNMDGIPDGWTATGVAVEATPAPTAAGAFTARETLQHDFAAKDITFADSTAPGIRITSIKFADREVWGSASGVPAGALAVTGQLRNLLSGNRLRAGLAITVTGTVTGAGTVVGTIIGAKPKITC